MRQITNIKQLGVSYERRTIQLLEREGYETFRSPGSLGVADMLACKPGQHLMIHVKRAQRRDPVPMSVVIGDQPWNLLFEHAARAGFTPLLAVWTGLAKAHIRLYELTGRHESRSHYWPCERFVLNEIAEMP